MRYYKIIIKSPSGQLWTPPSLKGVDLGGASFTSLINGQTLPGAWNVELDIFNVGFATPGSNSIVTVWGVSIDEISQASKLNGFNISVYGGMAAGLPLATVQAGYAGLLTSGQILPAFGNWIGTEMWLSFIIYPGPSSSSTTTPTQPTFGSNSRPINLVHNWQQGNSLSSAITATIQAATGITPKVNISSNLGWQPQYAKHVVNTMEQYNRFLQQISAAINAGMSNYSPITVYWDGKDINVFDSSFTGQSTKQLQFFDLIGQPVWLGTGVQFKTPMRADINVGTIVTMPQTQFTQTSQSSLLASSAANSQFQGSYQVNQVHHIGHFRQGDADSWVTVFDAVSQPG